MKRILTTLAVFLAIGFASADDRPNIVWIVVDDMSSHFGYQGEPLVTTPRVDRLAKEGIVFSRAYATAPVCSTFRSAMITGMYQTTIGAHNHRSSRGELKVELSQSVRPIPELFREAGYFTTIADASGKRNGKQDYDFAYEPSDFYDGVDYNQRAEGQPFFAQFQLRGGKIRNSERGYKAASADMDIRVDRSAVKLPPYYPDHPVIREDWAQYLDSVNYTDIEVGRILDRLEKDGALDNTVVFFLTDHGISHARGKQFLYEEGILIPFVVWGPGLLSGESFRDELIAHIDLGASSLQLAGIPLPSGMQGRPLFGPDANPRDYVVSARDRCDETIDRIRSIRKGDFKYIRNFYPQRPYLQPCAYKDAKPFMPVLRELYAAGKLNEVQSLHMAETRPEEELYDLTRDPWEINNLASDPAYQNELSGFRALLGRWVMDTDDKGRFPESIAMYDSDMEPYLKTLRVRKPEAVAKIEANIALMKQWRMEGK
ncbi:MAG: sulfatase [Opitutales bacterium]|nr:sulfatase [Opitutales bacterium]